MREGGGLEKVENRTGEVEEEQRSLFETGGDDDADCGDDDAASSSKNDLLLPHTIADIVQSQSQSSSANLTKFRPNPSCYRNSDFDRIRVLIFAVYCWDGIRDGKKKQGAHP